MTTASLLKQAGYTTGVVGKWHLGFGTQEKPVDWNGELKPGPLEVGFDYFFGDVANRWGCCVENHRIVGLTPEDPIRSNDKKSIGGKAAFTMVSEDNATVLHEKAIAFIEKNASAGSAQAKPFYLHYVPNNIHTPLTPNKRFKGTSQCGVYGDFIKELDWSVGEVLATLDRLGLAENTLVIFTSDNGGVYEKNALAAGHRCCAPLNGQKADIWDGGSRVPFLARWPGHIPSNATSDQVLCITDMLATFAAVTGQILPPDAGPDSFDQLPVMLGKTPTAQARPNLIVQSGKDTVSNKKTNKETEIWAVREGTWKLVLGQSGGCSALPGKGRIQLRFGEVGMINSDYTTDGNLKPDAPPLQLYDLAADLGETKNVYLDHPDIVARLKKLYKELVKNGRSRP
jgi:arylsulfatase A-like enzyme